MLALLVYLSYSLVNLMCSLWLVFVFLIMCSYFILFLCLSSSYLFLLFLYHCHLLVTFMCFLLSLYRVCIVYLFVSLYCSLLFSRPSWILLLLALYFCLSSSLVMFFRNVRKVYMRSLFGFMLIISFVLFVLIWVLMID
jgi:hypothetical protein